MAARNPYALDPLLAEGFSNLTRALVGDPQSDVYSARADLLRQQIEQSKASGRQSDAAASASGALARLRAAEAVGEKVKSDRLATLFAQVSPDNVHPLAETAFMNSMGFDGTIDELGNVVKSIRPGGPLMSEPMRGSQDGHILTRKGMGTDTLMSLLVGDGTYEPDSMSNALTNLGEGRLSAMAKSMILNGTPAQQAAGMKMLFPQGGEYQDTGAVASRLAQTIAGDVDIAKINNDAAITIGQNNDQTLLDIAGVEKDSALAVAQEGSASAEAVAKIEGATLEAIASGEAVTAIEVAKLDNISREKIAGLEINAQKIIAGNLNISNEKMKELEWDSKEDIAAALNLSTERIAALGNTKEEQIAAALNLSTLEIEKLGFTSAEAIAKALNLTSIEIANLKNAAGITMNKADNATKLSIAELMMANNSEIATAADIAAIQMNDANNAAMLTANDADNVTKTAIAAADNANALKIAQAQIDGKPIILNPGQSAYTAQGGQAVANAAAEPDFTLKEGEVRFVLQTDGSFKQVQGPGKPVKLVAGEGQTVTLVNSETGNVIKTVQGTAKGEVLTAGEGETVVMVDSTGQEIAKVEGRAKTFAPNSTSNSTDEWKYNTNFDKDFKATGSPDFNGPMVAALKSAGNDVIKAKMAADPSLSRQQAYAKFILPMIGEVKLVNYGYDFNMPLHFYNGYARKINSVRTNPEELAEAKTRLIQHATTTLGLDEDQAEGIYDQIIAGR